MHRTNLGECYGSKFDLFATQTSLAFESKMSSIALILRESDSWVVTYKPSVALKQGQR